MNGQTTVPLKQRSQISTSLSDSSRWGLSSESLISVRYLSAPARNLTALLDQHCVASLRTVDHGRSDQTHCLAPMACIRATMTRTAAGWLLDTPSASVPSSALIHCTFMQVQRPSKISPKRDGNLRAVRICMWYRCGSREIGKEMRMTKGSALAITAEMASCTDRELMKFTAFHVDEGGTARLERMMRLFPELERS